MKDEFAEAEILWGAFNPFVFSELDLARQDHPAAQGSFRKKGSAPTGLAFALVAPADPGVIAALDHAGTRLDDLHSVVLHVVIRAEDSSRSGRSGAST